MPRDGAMRQKKSRPHGWRAAFTFPCRCVASLRQFNRKTFHTAGQCYGDVRHSSVQMVSSLIHFRTSGNHIDRSGEQQRGNNDKGYVAHGSPLSRQRVGIGRLRQSAVMVVTKFLFFVDFHPVPISATVVVSATGKKAAPC